MDLGAIEGDDLRFIHQAFITDTLMNTLAVPTADTRLYYIDDPARKRLVGIVTETSPRNLRQTSRPLQGRLQPHVNCPAALGHSHRNGFPAVLRGRLQKRAPDRQPARPPSPPICSRPPCGCSVRLRCRFLAPRPRGATYTIGMSGSYHITCRISTEIRLHLRRNRRRVLLPKTQLVGSSKSGTPSRASRTSNSWPATSISTASRATKSPPAKPNWSGTAHLQTGVIVERRLQLLNWMRVRELVPAQIEHRHFYRSAPSRPTARPASGTDNLIPETIADRHRRTTRRPRWPPPSVTA